MKNPPTRKWHFSARLSHADKRQFASLCVLRGVSMEEMIRTLIREFIAREKGE